VTHSLLAFGRTLCSLCTGQRKRERLLSLERRLNASRNDSVTNIAASTVTNAARRESLLGLPHQPLLPEPVALDCNYFNGPEPHPYVGGASTSSSVCIAPPEPALMGLSDDWSMSIEWRHNPAERSTSNTRGQFESACLLPYGMPWTNI
jgi:hypothetical protein